MLSPPRTPGLEELALAVVDQLFVECPADPLCRATAHLAFDERRIERPADVLGDGVTDQRDDPRLAVDPHVDEVGCARGCEALLHG